MSKLVVVVTLLVLIAAICTHIYVMSLKYQGVNYVLLFISVIAKIVTRGLGDNLANISRMSKVANESSIVETETLRIETIPLSYSLDSSELYLKEFGNHSIANYALRVYQPKANKKGGYPTLVFIHGGGWMFGSLETNDDFCQFLSNRGFVIISVDYRKTPDHIYPASLNDVIHSLLWIGKNHLQYNLNIGQLIISGESAGGHLSIHAQTRLLAIGKDALEKHSIPAISHQALINPVVEFYKLGDSKYKSYLEFGDYFLTNEIMDMFWRFWYGNLSIDEVKANPYMSIISAIDTNDVNYYAKFAKGFVWISEYDILRDEAEKFVEIVNQASPNKLKAQRFKTIHGIVTNQMHYEEFYNELIELIHKTLE